jgi:hypothetical protein
MKFKTLDYKIGQHFLPLIFNNDASGLDDDDEKAWEIFELTLPSKIGHWSSAGDYNQFAVCEVTGLFSDVDRLTYYYEDDTNE